MAAALEDIDSEAGPPAQAAAQSGIRSFAPIDLDRYLAAHDLSQKAETYIRASIIGGPSRPVGRHTTNNVCTEFQSAKMGFSVPTESRTGELSYSVHLDFDSSVIGFNGQPPVIEIRTTDRRGRTSRRPYTPDYCVLFANAPQIVEVKPQTTLERLVTCRPVDWQREGDEFVFRPAQLAFADIGLTHKVISTARLCKVRTANLKLLLKALGSDIAVHPQLKHQVVGALERAACMRLNELADAVHACDLSPLIRLLAERLIHTDLSRYLITEPETCWVALEPAYLGLVKLLDPIDPQDALILGSDVAVPIEKAPPAKQAQVGLDILESLQSGTAADRSARRWRKQISTAMANGESALQAVTPKTYRSGNRKSKLAEPVRIFLEGYLDDDESYANAKRLSVKAAHKKYRAAARQKHPDFTPATRPTFKSYLDKQDQKRIARGRGGKRAANAAESPTEVEERALKAQRPFECATCDHTEADIQCLVVEANGKRYAKRPWVTVLRDIATMAILAIWIAFRPPSRIAVAMVLRRCLKKHGRLPETIFVDRGAEFRSVYMSALAAHCGTDLALRPAGHSRYGAEAERVFGHFREQWLVLRPGNLVEKGCSRSISSSHSASNTAEIPTSLFLPEAQAFADWMNTCSRGTRLAAPDVMLADGLSRFSLSGHVIPYDNAFIVASAVDVREFKLDPQRGLHIGEHRYWHPRLATPGLRKKDISARSEPEDISRMYVRIRDEWVVATSGISQIYAHLSPTERVSRSIRLDGLYDLKDSMEEEADQLLFTSLGELDAMRESSEPQPVAEGSARPPTQSQAANLFAAARETPLPNLNSERW